MVDRKKCLVPVILEGLLGSSCFSGLSTWLFLCGSRDVIRNEGHLHHWKCHCCDHASSEHVYGIPAAREGHTNTAERPLGSTRGGLSSASPPICRSWSLSLALPGRGQGVVSVGMPLAGLQVLLILLPGVGCVCLSPCSSQHGLQKQHDTKGEGGKSAFPGLMFC